MTRESILARFPHASRAFIDANLDRLPTTQPQPAPVLPLERAGEGKEACRTRLALRFDVFAPRPTDSDNARVKEVIDSLRHAGILADDDWRHIAGTSVYVHKAEAGKERTEVRVYES